MLLEFRPIMALDIVSIVVLSNIESLQVTSSTVNSQHIASRRPFAARSHILHVHKCPYMLLLFDVPNSHCIVHRRSGAKTIDHTMPLYWKDFLIVRMRWFSKINTTNEIPGINWNGLWTEMSNANSSSGWHHMLATRRHLINHTLQNKQTLESNFRLNAKRFWVLPDIRF